MQSDEVCHQEAGKKERADTTREERMQLLNAGYYICDWTLYYMFASI